MHATTTTTTNHHKSLSCKERPMRKGLSMKSLALQTNICDDVVEDRGRDRNIKQMLRMCVGGGQSSVSQHNINFLFLKHF